MKPYKEHTIRLNLGNRDYTEIINVSDSTTMPTLRDVATILYCLVGQGVQWQLSRELSMRTGFDLEKIQTALEDICEEYDGMDDEEALQKWETLGEYIETEEDRNNPLLNDIYK